MDHNTTAYVSYYNHITTLYNDVILKYHREWLPFLSSGKPFLVPTAVLSSTHVKTSGSLYLASSLHKLFLFLLGSPLMMDSGRS